MRDIIIAEIKRIAAANGGKAPGAQLFLTETGIIESKWRGVYWARWGDALTEAGFAPNEWQARLDPEALLARMATLVAEKGAIPTRSEQDILRRSDPSVPSYKTLSGHFPSRAHLVEALRSFCERRGGLEHVSALLPEVAPRRPDTAAKAGAPEGWVYLLKSGAHFKIGRSDQLETRVKKITIALPEATTLVQAIRTDDPPGIEAYWHRRFDDRRANGEWFKLTAVDVAAFSRRKFQ